MKLKNLLLLTLILSVIGIAIFNSNAINGYITQFKEYRQFVAKKAVYQKQYRDIDWPNDDGTSLKMRIPRKYITQIYRRTKTKPYEWIVMSASYPEFQANREVKNLTKPKMLRIELIEKQNDPNGSRKRWRSSAENHVRRKKAYLYPNDWGLDHYKEIACLENHPNISAIFIEKSDPFRDELTPPDCWISFSGEMFLPNSNTYSISYHCTPLIQRPNGFGGCTVFSHYRGIKLDYVMRRYMIPEWKAVHESILGFLDQFVITEHENITSED